MKSPKLLAQALAVAASTALVFTGGTAAVATVAGSSSSSSGHTATASDSGSGDCNGSSAFKSVSYSVNGHHVSNLQSGVTVGSTVSATFELRNSCDKTDVGIAAYEAKSAHGDTEPFEWQKLVTYQDGTFDANVVSSVSVVVPNCYYQVDFYTGQVAQPGDYYSPSGRLVGTALGGGSSCVSGSGTTTTTSSVPASTTSTTVGTTTSTTEATTTSTTRPGEGATTIPGNGTTTTQPGDTTVTTGGNTTTTVAGTSTTVAGGTSTTVAGGTSTTVATPTTIAGGTSTTIRPGSTTSTTAGSTTSSTSPGSSTTLPGSTTSTTTPVAGTSGTCPRMLKDRIKNYYVTINGQVFPNLDSAKVGDVVTVHFTVASGCKEQLSLASYKATSLDNSQSGVLSQELYESGTGWFLPGSYTLSVEIPPCFYQVDFVEGAVIEHFGPVGSNNYYAGRILDSALGGTESCGSGSTTTSTSTTQPDVDANSTSTTSPRPGEGATSTSTTELIPSSVEAAFLNTTGSGDDTTSTTSPATSVEAENVSADLATTGIDVLPLLCAAILFMGFGGLLMQTARRFSN